MVKVVVEERYEAAKRMPSHQFLRKNERKYVMSDGLRVPAQTTIFGEEAGSGISECEAWAVSSISMAQQRTSGKLTTFAWEPLIPHHRETSYYNLIRQSQPCIIRRRKAGSPRRACKARHAMQCRNTFVLGGLARSRRCYSFKKEKQANLGNVSSILKQSHFASGMLLVTNKSCFIKCFAYSQPFVNDKALR